MTKEEATRLLETYRETDDETSEEYGYSIIRYVGMHGDCHLFECALPDYAEDSTMTVAVCPDGDVLPLPT